MTPKQIAASLGRFNQDLPYIVGSILVEFALDNWDRQGYMGVSFQKWEPRKSGRPGALLVGKQSGRLRRSIKFKPLQGGKVEAGSDLDYSGIHNTGGIIHVRVTEKSRKFFWKMFYLTQNEMWRGMALTKKRKMTIRIPKRQFIGHSPEIDKRIEKAIDKRLNQILA